MSVKITRNSTDGDMISLYSNHDGEIILWCVVHKDVLMDLDISEDELDNHEFKLSVEPC